MKGLPQCWGLGQLQLSVRQRYFLLTEGRKTNMALATGAYARAEDVEVE